MAQEHFPDAKRQLFGPGFEQRVKSRSETADTIKKAAKVSTPVTGCTQKTGTYLSLEKNTDTPNVVVIGYTGTEACNIELNLYRKSIVLYFD